MWTTVSPLLPRSNRNHFYQPVVPSVKLEREKSSTPVSLDPIIAVPTPARTTPSTSAECALARPPARATAPLSPRRVTTPRTPVWSQCVVELLVSHNFVRECFKRFSFQVALSLPSSGLAAPLAMLAKLTRVATLLPVTNCAMLAREAMLTADATTPRPSAQRAPSLARLLRQTHFCLARMPPLSLWRQVRRPHSHSPQSSPIRLLSLTSSLLTTGIKWFSLEHVQTMLCNLNKLQLNCNSHFHFPSMQVKSTTQVV